MCFPGTAWNVQENLKRWSLSLTSVCVPAHTHTHTHTSAPLITVAAPPSFARSHPHSAPPWCERRRQLFAKQKISACAASALSVALSKWIKTPRRQALPQSRGSPAPVKSVPFVEATTKELTTFRTSDLRWGCGVRDNSNCLTFFLPACQHDSLILFLFFTHLWQWHSVLVALPMNHYLSPCLLRQAAHWKYHRTTVPFQRG